MTVRKAKTMREIQSEKSNVNMTVRKAKTMREIQSEKSNVKRSTITVSNISKQIIGIHLDAPRGKDFFVFAQDIRLLPGQSHTFIKDRVRPGQIERLTKMGKISIIKETIVDDSVNGKTVIVR